MLCAPRLCPLRKLWVLCFWGVVVALCTRRTCPSPMEGEGKVLAGFSAGSRLILLCCALVKVLLDLETASRYLTISSDCRTLQIAEGWQNLSDTPKRFTGSASVLGSQGFTAGRHYWELEVGDGNNWAVGVALESVQRKESLMMAMEKIWALRMDWDRSYTALTMPPAPLSLQEEPRRIRVHLDYEAGQVTFYNTDNMQQLLQFKVSFSEKVFPYFWLGLPGTYIKLRS